MHFRRLERTKRNCTSQKDNFIYLTLSGRITKKVIPFNMGLKVRKNPIGKCVRGHKTT